MDWVFRPGVVVLSLLVLGTLLFPLVKARRAPVPGRARP